MFQRDICKRKKQVKWFLIETATNRRSAPIGGRWTISSGPERPLSFSATFMTMTESAMLTNNPGESTEMLSVPEWLREDKIFSSISSGTRKIRSPSSPRSWRDAKLFLVLIPASKTDAVQKSHFGDGGFHQTYGSESVWQRPVHFTDCCRRFAVCMMMVNLSGSSWTITNCMAERSQNSMRRSLVSISCSFDTGSQMNSTPRVCPVWVYEEQLPPDVPSPYQRIRHRE
jgi:hypothetical protein